MRDLVDSALKGLGYVLSLPERTLRSLAAVTGGTTSLLSEALFPEVLRGTTLYRIFIGDTQQFLIRKVAAMEQAQPGIAGATASAAAAGEGEAASQDQAGAGYVQRKVLGAGLEAAGLLAMHVSPLWVFAIVGDAAAGGGVFLNRLVAQLKANGVIAEGTSISGLTDLLEAVQAGSNQTATAIDTPPMSREQIANLAGELASGYADIVSSGVNLLPRMETIWTQMEQVASRENISFERLSGILSLDVTDWGRKGMGAAMAVGQAGTALFNETILDSYARTLESINRQGVGDYLSSKMTPFLKAAGGHFEPSRTTWTQALWKRLGCGGPE